MNERPIIMQAESVRAILEGHKTQTRRVIPADGPDEHGWWYWRRPNRVCAWREVEAIELYQGIINNCPYGQPGDRLWVRETWTRNNWNELLYRADWQGFESDGMGWKSPIHMPRAASRITLELTSVRVERIRDISQENARAEGVDYMPSAPAALDHRSSYLQLWNKINGKKHPWESNPWVWVLSFKRVEDRHADR